MIFFRYQNTKTLETNSQYVDMKMLYNEVIYHRDYYYQDKTVTAELMVDMFYDEFSKELIYRDGLDESMYKDIIRKVCEIAINSELKGNPIESKSRDRKNAYEQIDELMKDYPLKGIFVIPEYSEEFKSGTKYSIPELRAKIICNLNVPTAKYLAIYSGDVIKKEMVCGGTLLKPAKILGVLPLFKNAVETYKHLSAIDVFYRDIEDANKLSEAMNFQKSFLKDCLKYSSDNTISKQIASSHVRELIILEALNISKSTYKDLQYRFKDDRHLIEISKKNKVFKFCVFNKDINANNLLNNDLIKHEGFYIEEDLFNNTRVKQKLHMELAV